MEMSAVTFVGLLVMAFLAGIGAATVEDWYHERRARRKDTTDVDALVKARKESTR